jgi:hypothetical protein
MFLLQDGMGYSPYSPAMTPWTLTLWRGDYTKMMQQLKGLQVKQKAGYQCCGSGIFIPDLDSKRFRSWIRIRNKKFKYF